MDPLRQGIDPGPKFGDICLHPVEVNGVGTAHTADHARQNQGGHECRSTSDHVRDSGIEGWRKLCSVIVSTVNPRGRYCLSHLPSGG